MHLSELSLRPPHGYKEKEKCYDFENYNYFKL